MKFSHYLINAEWIMAHSLTFEHGEDSLIVSCNKLTRNNQGGKDVLNILAAKIQNNYYY